MSLFLLELILFWANLLFSLPIKETNRVTFAVKHNYRFKFNVIKIFHELVKKIEMAYSSFPQGEIVSQLRRSIPEYSRGVWSIAMPFNRGGSELSKNFQLTFLSIRQQMQKEMGVDLGHVIASMDIAQSFDIINDTYISWAGDLGSEVLHIFRNGTHQQIGQRGSRASMPDILGDIDGDNIAHHMQSKHALDSLFDYYQGTGAHTRGVNINNRYRTFAKDLGLLDNNGKLQYKAANIIEEQIRGFIYQYTVLNNIKNPSNVIGIFTGNAQFISDTNIPNLTKTAAEQFIEIIISGIKDELLIANC